MGHVQQTNLGEPLIIRITADVKHTILLVMCGFNPAIHAIVNDTQNTIFQLGTSISERFLDYVFCSITLEAIRHLSQYRDILYEFQSYLDI